MKNYLKINRSLQYIHLSIALFIILWLNNGIVTFITVYMPNSIKISVFLLWLAMALIIKTKYLSRNFINFIPLVIFYLVLLISYMINPSIEVIYNLKTTILIMVIFSIFIFYYDTCLKNLKIIIALLMLDNVFIGINTFIKLQQIPNLSRYLSGAEDYIISVLETTKYLAVGNYTYAYSMVMVSYLFVYNILYNTKYKIISYIAYILLFIILIKMEFTIAFLFNVVGTIYLIANKVKRKYYIISIFVILLFIVILIFIINIQYVTLVNVDFFPESLLVKINEINDLFKGKISQKSALYLRLTVYLQSIDLFFSNPTIGILGQEGRIGGHSSWFDFLAQMGMLSLLISYFFILFYRHIKKTISKRTLIYVNICFLYFMFLGFVNTIYNARIIMTLIIFVPFVAKVLDQRKCKLISISKENLL